jgi:hypothetical protein
MSEPQHAQFRSSEELTRFGCGAAGVVFAPPFVLADVVRIVREGLQYDVTPDDAYDAANDGSIPAPEGSCVHIHRLVALLEARRRWLPGSPLHNHKKTPARLAVENGTFDTSRVASLTVGDLLLCLTVEPDIETREILYETIRIRLAQEEAAR